MLYRRQYMDKDSVILKYEQEKMKNAENAFNELRKKK